MSHIDPEFIRPAVKAMKGYQPGEQPQGNTRFIKLNTNENPYPPSPKVFEAIQNALTGDRLRKYPDPNGWDFRHAAAKVHGVDPASIVIGNGSDEILSMAVRAIVPEGGVVVAPTPSYVLYHTLAHIQGAQLKELPFESDWSLDPSKLEGVGHLTFIPNPNSPTGTFINPDSFKAWPTPLVLDEAYVDFTSANGLHLVLQNPHVIVTRTFSKAYSLAGLRFGYAVAHPNVAEQLYKVKDSYNCDVIALAAATAAMNDQPYLQQTRSRIIATRSRLQNELNSLGFKTLPSHANFVWCKHSGQSEKAIYEELKNRGILIRYFHYPNWGTGLRISVGTDIEIDQLLQQLRTLL